MSNRTKHVIIVLSMIVLMATLNGCSIFISTPRTAKIHIQGLDNHHYDYIIPLDAPIADEATVDIRISKRYALQLDFDWLWESTIDIDPGRTSVDEDTIPPLIPWMMCKYRF